MNRSSELKQAVDLLNVHIFDVLNSAIGCGA